MTPGLLMPVRAIAKPWAYVVGTYADGTIFKQSIWNPIAPVDVVNLSWFHNHENPVVNIGSFEYTGRTPWERDDDPAWTKRRFRFEGDRAPGPQYIGDPIQQVETVKSRYNNFYHTMGSDMKAWEIMTFAKIDALKLEPVCDVIS